MSRPERARFGLSTHLFHGERLERRHFERIGARGFDLVEVFATRTHFDYHDRRSVDEVGGWLADLGLTAWSVHAPICDTFTGGVWGRAYSNATTDEAPRAEAVDEARASIEAARRLGCPVVVLHLGIPRGQPVAAHDNDAGALRRSLESIAEASVAAGIQLALEVIPNHLASPAALVDWLAGDLDLGHAAACFDTGHAHLMGGVAEGVDTLSGRIVTTHLHDNAGVADDHLIPFDGTIDWAAAMTALSKIGYAGPLVFELPDHGNAEATLDRVVGARRRLQAILDELSRPFDFTDD